MLSLDGRKARDFYADALAKRVAALAARGISPRLAIVQVGDNAESGIYIEQKKRFAAKIGAGAEHVKLPADVSFAGLAAKVGELNARRDVHGIIVQLPISAHLDKIAAVNLIHPSKDVDGLTDESQRLLAEGKPGFVPATAKGVMALLDFYKVSVAGKRAVVFGRSRLVGGPTAALLRLRGADVSVCHSQTPDDERRALSRAADIVVVAVGRPRLVDAGFVKPGAVVVDVGINKLPAAPGAKAEIAGDVDAASVSSLAAALSPVPGGVGPMTVLSLFDNLVSSAERNAAEAL